MVWWLLLYVGLGVAGIGVLLALTIRLWRQVRRLGREVAAASERIAAATDEMSRAAPPH